MPPEITNSESIISHLDQGTVVNNAGDWFDDLEEVSEQRENLEDLENRHIIEMRDRWSNWVLILIVLIVVFDMVLVALLGGKRWQFDNATIVVTVITDNFLKIVGLGILITREIFKKIYKKPLAD